MKFLSALAIFFMSLLLLFPLAALKASELKPFQTDGCSVVPDGNYQDCCIDHDLAYWQGGTRQDRLEADKNLRTCVKKKTGSDFLAGLIYLGVRTGGLPDLTTGYRFGYGWRHIRDYKPLTEREKDLIERMMPEDPYSLPIRDNLDGPEPIPTLTGDYCADDGARRIREQINRDIEFTSIESRPGLMNEIVRYEFTASACRGKIVVIYRPDEDNFCKRPRYRPVESEDFAREFYDMFGTGSCQELIRRKHLKHQ